MVTFYGDSFMTPTVTGASCCGERDRNKNKNAYVSNEFFFTKRNHECWRSDKGLLHTFITLTLHIYTHYTLDGDGNRQVESRNVAKTFRQSLLLNFMKSLIVNR